VLVLRGQQDDHLRVIDHPRHGAALSLADAERHVSSVDVRNRVGRALYLV
jgi:hypothetical protein